MSGHLHRHALRDPGPDQIPHSRSPEVMGYSTGNAGQAASSLPGPAEFLDRFPVPMTCQGTDDAPPLQPGGAFLLCLQDGAELFGEKEGPAFVILRGAWIRADRAGLEIHAAPLERLNLAADPPARDVGAKVIRPWISSGRCRRTDSNWRRSKNPVRTLFSRSVGSWGLLMILPACAARLNARLIAVNSRLIVPFLAPSDWRFAMYLRMSAVVIQDARASPKNACRAAPGGPASHLPTGAEFGLRRISHRRSALWSAKWGIRSTVRPWQHKRPGRKAHRFFCAGIAEEN